MSDSANGTPTATPASTPDSGGTSAPASTASAAPAPTDWTTSLNDDLRGYVQTKGFKAPQDVVESYRNFEKLHGVPQDRMLKIPENLDTPEGRAIFEKLGAPKDPKEYKIEFAKEAADAQAADWFRDVAHKNGFTHRQVENFLKAYNERAQTMTKAQMDAHESVIKEADMALKKEWGSAFEQNKSIADQAAIKLGMNETQIKALGAALGPDKALKLLADLGKATGEAGFVTGQTAGSNMMTPEQAKSEIRGLMNDQAFIARVSRGEPEALKQWNRLNQMASPPRPT
jgi:hypothetical protein